RDYVLRVTNPLPYRVAVALSVDGLNTIDAKHTDAWGATKWVLGPYESTVIPGWQVNGSTARRFTFTSEKRSYGAWLGKTEDLGVIEAVSNRRRGREPRRLYYDSPSREDRPRDESGAGTMGAPMEEPGSRQKDAERAAPSAPRTEAKKPQPQLSDDYA